MTNFIDEWNKCSFYSVSLKAGIRIRSQEALTFGHRYRMAKFRINKRSTASMNKATYRVNINAPIGSNVYNDDVGLISHTRERVCLRRHPPFTFGVAMQLKLLTALAVVQTPSDDLWSDCGLTLGLPFD